MSLILAPSSGFFGGQPSWACSATCSARGGGPPGTISRPVGCSSLVELQLPVVAGEGHPASELAHVGLDRARRRPCARSAPGRCGPCSAAYTGAGKAPPKRVLTSVMPSPMSGSRNTWIVAGPATAQRLHHAPAELDQLLVVDHFALDRLASARLEHRARDRVQAAPVVVAEAVDRQLRTVHRALDHHRLGYVVDEEACLRGVVGEVDRARARAATGLDHHRIVERVEIGVRQDRRRRGQAQAAEQQVGLVLVVCRAAISGEGTSAGSRPSARARASISMSRSVSGSTAPTACSAQRRSSAGTYRGPRSAARPCARARRTAPAPAGSGRRRSCCELGEAGDDVIALAGAGQQDRGAIGIGTLRGESALGLTARPPSHQRSPCTGRSRRAPSRRCATGSAGPG